MTTTAKKKQQSDIAAQMAEFERLNGKVKTLAIEPRSKDGKPITNAEKAMKKTVRNWGKKQQKMFGVKKGSKPIT